MQKLLVEVIILILIRWRVQKCKNISFGPFSSPAGLSPHGASHPHCMWVGSKSQGKSWIQSHLNSIKLWILAKYSLTRDNGIHVHHCMDGLQLHRNSLFVLIFFRTRELLTSKDSCVETFRHYIFKYCLFPILSFIWPEPLYVFGPLNLFSQYLLYLCNNFPSLLPWAYFLYDILRFPLEGIMKSLRFNIFFLLQSS